MPSSNCQIVSDMLLRQYNARDLTAVDDYIAENHFDHNPTPGQEPGRAGVKRLIERVLAGGNITAEIHDSFGEGDRVATRYTITITHRDDFRGYPTAGKTTAFHIVEIDRITDGKIVESWGESNALAVLQKLGNPAR